MSALVSIIMPGYNAAGFISESIDSVLSQTYTNWELVIVDDGSTDNTAAICKAYQDCDNRIKYYYQANGRQGKARNLGVLNSKGSILAFLDTDDLWLPEKLQVSMDIFQKGDHDLLFTDAYVFSKSEDLRSGSPLQKLGVLSGVYKGQEGMAAFLFKNKIPMLTVLVKKEAVVAVGCFNDRGIAEDYELWLNLLRQGYVLKGVDVCLSLYRVHENATTSADKLAVEEVAQMLTDFFRDQPKLKSNYRLQIESWLRRYLKLHATSNKTELRLPLIFNGFNYYICLYRIITGLRKFLPARVFNYLLYRLL